MFRNTNSTNRLVLFAAVLAASVAASNAFSQSSQGIQKTTAGAGKSSVAAEVRPDPNFLSLRAKMYYQGVWGVDSFRVKWAESGELVRFSWRVVDPDKAAVLNDKKAEPTLIDPQAGVSLVVPAVSNVGKMRQASTPEAGKSYWMAFSNVGRRVKRGDRVSVVIGKFRAEGLAVE
jgi:hypothetical protein